MWPCNSYRVSTTSVGTENKTLTLNVTVRNQGEDSYLTQYRVTIPQGFEYGGVNSDGKVCLVEGDWTAPHILLQHKVSCSPAEVEAGAKQTAVAQPNGSYEFVCDVGNPLLAGERANFGVKLIGSNVDPSRDSVEVRMAVNSTNPEEASATGDNDIVVKVGVEVKAQLGLSGRSNPEQLDFSIRNRTRGESAVFDFEAGPVVSHLYQVG